MALGDGSTFNASRSGSRDATIASLRNPPRVKRLLEIGIDPVRRALFHHWNSTQAHHQISPYARVNGQPPKNPTFVQLVETHFADWHLEVGGLVELVERARPRPEAKWLVFRTLDEKCEAPGHGEFYETIDIETARRTQTLLAYEMNGEPLTVEHGAPLRPRVENQLGYKMVKWIRAIEFVEDFSAIGRGQGGWRDDVLDDYPSDAGI